MKKMWIILSGLLIVALILGAVGCGGGDEDTPTPAGQGTPSPTVKPITLKLVTSQPENSVAGQSYYRFADLMEDYTDGRVLVDIYPGGQLFPAIAEWEAVSTGSVDIIGDSSFWIREYVPDVMVFYIDGLWESYEHAYAALEESELPRVLAEKVEEAGPVKMLGVLPGSMVLSVLNSVKETKLLEDLDGLKTQSSPGAPPPALYDYSGMAAIPIAFEETSTAFIQGIVDAVHSTPGSMRDFQMYETGKHMLSRIAIFSTLMLLINEDSWDSLPGDIQDIILNKVMPETYEFSKTGHREDEEAALETMEQNLETFHWVTQEDHDAYVEYAGTHPIIKVQILMTDPEILEIVEGLRPSRQQQ